MHSMHTVNFVPIGSMHTVNFVPIGASLIYTFTIHPYIN